jgi:hypothetical protein
VTFSDLPAGEFSIRSVTTPTITATGLAIADQREYGILSVDEAWLKRLAGDTGGATASVTEVAHLIARIPVKQRVEKRESIWRLWDSGWLLIGLFVLLSVEWIWRKLVGLV